MTTTTAATIKLGSRLHVGTQSARANKDIRVTVIGEKYGIYQVKLPNGLTARVDYKDIMIDD